jgi:N-acetyl-anhydromuramoyl-L-alanine amidase
LRGAWRVDGEGFVSSVRLIPSPNFDDRPQGTTPELIVIHNISLPPGEFGGPGVESLFCNALNPDEHPYYQTIRELKVSSHFFIRRDGELIQFVSCLKRAWHAGLSTWRGRERCNDFSIGIELEGTDDLPFADTQYGALDKLIPTIISAYPILDIVGHSDISPGRKTDPGSSFEWTRITKYYSNSSDS